MKLDNLNRRQRVALWAGFSLIALSILFPQWKSVPTKGEGSTFTKSGEFGYDERHYNFEHQDPGLTFRQFLLSPPAPVRDTANGNEVVAKFEINTSRQVTEVLLVLVLTGVGIVALGGSSNHPNQNGA